MNVEVTGSPDVTSFTNAIASSFNIDSENVVVNLLLGRNGRLLSSGLRGSQRFLGSSVTISYEVIVPPITAESLFSAAVALAESNTTVGQAFARSMSSSGISVLSVVYVHRPVVLQSVLVRDASGRIIKSRTAPAPVSGQKDSSDSNAGMIVGIVVGSVFFLLISGAVGRYLMLMRKKSEV